MVLQGNKERNIKRINKIDMDLENKSKQDNYIMRTLKLEYIEHLIANTSKGVLSMRLDKGGTGKDYYLVLDAVPLDNKESKELIGIIK